MVLEFGGKGNAQTIVNQIRNSLRDRNYDKQLELNLWYFPTIGEYSSELESTGFRVLLAEDYDRPTALVDKDTGI